MLLLSLFVHEVLFAWTQEEWKTRNSFPCSQVSSLFLSLPLGCFAWTHCHWVSFKRSLVIFLPFTQFLLQSSTPSQVISFWDTASWWREAVTAEFQGVFPTIHNKWTMLDVPVIHISPHISLLGHLTLLGPLLFSISLFCQQNNITNPFFFTKTGWLSAVTWTMGLSLGG